MKSLFGFIVMLAVSAAAVGQQTVNLWAWTNLAPAQLPRGASVVSMNGRMALKIENPRNTPLQLLLLTVENPQVSAQVYAMKGEIRCDALHGSGFLEMWSYFPPAKPGLPEARDFSRMRIDSPGTGTTRGPPDWHPFSLPFNRMGVSAPPVRLQINLVLGGRGTVYLGPIRLVQYVDEKSYVDRDLGDVWIYGHTAHPWWSKHAAALATNLGTIVFLGAAFLMGALCWKRARRGLVVMLLRIHIGLGALCGVAAIVALVQRQPFAVWLPLSFSALILTVVYTAWLASVDKYYGLTPGQGKMTL
jgi:hypothetical protein